MRCRTSRFSGGPRSGPSAATGCHAIYQFPSSDCGHCILGSDGVRQSIELYLQELIAEPVASDDCAVTLRRVGYVFQRIGLDKKQVRALAPAPASRGASCSAAGFQGDLRRSKVNRVKFE